MTPEELWVDAWLQQRVPEASGMAESEIRKALKTPASQAIVQEAWDSILTRMDLSRRPVVWVAAPLEAFHLARKIGADQHDWAFDDLYYRMRVQERRTAPVDARPRLFDCARQLATDILNAAGWNIAWSRAYQGVALPGMEVARRSLNIMESLPYSIQGACRRSRRNPHCQLLKVWSAAGAVWVLRDRILCVPHPEVRRDGRRRIHAEDGPAITWSGRENYYFINGTEVPAWVVREPHKIAVAAVLGQVNAEVRRVMIDRMTVERFVAQAGGEALDRDEDAGGERNLRRIPLANDEPVVALVVRCPSTQAVYVLRVPPQMRTCREAAAWTFGFPAAGSYRPVAET